ncbi:MAG: hypothetical protein WBO09_06110 [Methylocystis silviterrae]|uniref:hypothetical protein n=1 Tax=Methylocystis silviterrae TaxID=2743612 RepID=UPI003C711AB4
MLDRQSQPSSGQSPRGALGAEAAGFFLALIGAALVRVDGVLEGMIGAGLGLEAISAYLGCARTAIFDEMARRGIVVAPEQLEKPLRARKGGWSACDHILLITAWLCGIPVAAIAELVGRTRGAVYGKRRRIGLAPRRRKSAEQSRKPRDADAPPVRRARRTRPRPAVADPPSREPVHARTTPSQGGPQQADEVIACADGVVDTATSLVAVIGPDGPENPCIDGVAALDLGDIERPTAEVVANDRDNAQAVGGDDLAAIAQEAPARQRPARARRSGSAKKSTKSNKNSASASPPRALEPAVAAAIAMFQERQVYRDVVLYGRHKDVPRTVELAVRALGGQMVASMVETMGEKSESTVKSYLLKMHLSTAKKLLIHAEFDPVTFRGRLDGMYRPHFSMEEGRLYFRNDKDRLRHCKLRDVNARRRERSVKRKESAPAVPTDAVPNVVVYTVNNKAVSLPALRCLE